MLRIKDIQKGLAHLVGWEQSEGNAPRIAESLTESESGLTFQQAHPLLTLDNIRAILPDLGTIEAWDNATEYNKGDIRSHDGKNYISLVSDNVGHEPGSDFNADYNDDFGDGYWRIYDQLSEYLRKMTDEGIARVANKMVEEKTLNGSSKQLFERKTLFDVAGRIDNRVANVHCLVGYRIEPLKGMGVTTQLHRIGLQMTGATGSVTVYLFHSSRKTPVKTFKLRIVSQKGYQWFNLDDTFMPYTGNEYRNDGGYWFVCYQQDALPYGMQAVNISRDWSKEPCGGCNVGDAVVYRKMIKYIKVLPFRVNVPATWSQNPELPDLDAVATIDGNCYGMNLDLSIGCDVSDFIVSQRSIFPNVLQKEVAVNVLRRILHNPNVKVNRNQMNAALQLDIEGSTYQKSSGLAGELAKAYKVLDLDTRSLDSACLACSKPGIRYGVM